jgi:type II secretory pathway component PulF
MPAQSETNLEEKLTRTGLWLLDAKLQSVISKPSGQQESKSWFAPSIKRRDLIDFCTLMSFQSKVGLPLMQALEVASSDCDNETLKNVLSGLQRHIESGLLFYEALEKYPQVFTAHFVSVIRAGETSSKLPEAFDDLGKYLEWVEQILAEVKQATMYPTIVLTVVMSFVIGLFIFVIPKFAELLASTNAKLPLLTQIIFGISDFMKGTWWFWLLALPLAVITVMVAKRHSKRAAILYDKAKLRMPIFGELNWMLAISRFTHNLAILYRAGIPVTTAMGLCQGLIGSVIVEDAVKAVGEAIKSGSTISEAMRKHPIFPPLLLRMVVMGETTGNLDHALDNVSDFYGQIIPRRIKKVLTVLEPAMTIFMIFMVGLVALSIYLPILSLMSNIRG